MKSIKQLLVYAAMAALLIPYTLSAQAEKAAAQAGKTVKETVKKTGQGIDKATGTGSTHRAKPTVPESEIAAAKADGKVWVNTETGVYHKGGQWYGATKEGKFMTENDAIKAGYRASKTKE
jgi:hypothetical protein